MNDFFYYLLPGQKGLTYYLLQVWRFCGSPLAPASWDGIFKLFRSSEIDSKESIPPTCVAWRAGAKTLFLLGS